MIGVFRRRLPFCAVYGLRRWTWNMSKEVKLAGGCMCGAVRYQAHGAPFAVNHCHCVSCRKHNGAPLVTLAGYRADQVVFSGEQRQIYQSSPGVGRAFCGKCGTPLTWEGEVPKIDGIVIEIHLSTFDDPNRLVPTSHVFDSERISWFDVADNLPRFSGFDDGTPAVRHGPVSEGLPVDFPS